MSFQFPRQWHGLYAQQEAAGQRAYDCAVIHPKVKLTLSPGSLLRRAAKPWRLRQRRGLARGRALRSKTLRACVRVQSTEMEGGTPRATLSVSVAHGTLTPRKNGKSARSG